MSQAKTQLRLSSFHQVMGKELVFYFIPVFFQNSKKNTGKRLDLKSNYRIGKERKLKKDEKQNQ